MFDAYRERFGKVPPQEVFHEYFYLFTPGVDGLPEAFARKLEDKGNAEECLSYLRDGRNARTEFASYGEFVEYARSRGRCN